MSDNWEEVQALFLAVADLPADEQSRFLEAACTDRPDLRREVESLLVADRTQVRATSSWRW